MTSSYGRRAFFFGLLAAPLLGGCVTKPAVRLDHAALRSASLRGVGLDIFLEINNKNSYDIEIRNVRADVVIAGRYPLAPLDIQPNQWLPADESTLVRVPIVIPWAIIPPLVSETVGSEEISYRVKGSADVTAVRMLGIERDNYPLNEGGSVSRQALIRMAQRMVRL
jgi:hypothetical protein